MRVSDREAGRFATWNRSAVIAFTLRAVLLLTAIANFVPLLPSLPQAGLDPSWIFGINQAVAQGLAFGRDIVYSYGPYAAIGTMAYHPSTDLMMLGGSLYLALSYGLCTVHLLKDVKLGWALALCIVLGGLMFSRDALFSSFPLLVGLLVAKESNPVNGEQVRRPVPVVVLGLLFFPFGLLGLIKVSLLPLCAAVAAMCSMVLLVNRRPVAAASCLLAPIVSMLAFWTAAGQALSAMPGYLGGMVTLMSGNTEAMALDGSLHEVILYLVACTGLLLAIVWHRPLSRSARALLLGTCLVFLFLAFKHGFVRHDLGHALIAASSILVAAFALPLVIPSRMAMAVAALAVLSWLPMAGTYVQTVPEAVRKSVELGYSSLWAGIGKRLGQKNWPRSEYDVAVKTLRAQANFALMPGSTDIYSAGQSLLIASGNTWSPRPVFQSHFAYTPSLAELNVQHLLGPRAPEHIVFRVEPIDGRLPSLEDGPSWPLLLRHYRSVRMENDFLFLEKMGRGASATAGQPKPALQIGQLGQRVQLPQSGQAVFARIDLRPTMLGRMAGLLYKSSPLQITVELRDGTTRSYRLVAGMAAAGFLVSPLIDSTQEFERLFSSPAQLEEKTVKAIVITPRAEGLPLWQAEYAVSFKQP